MRPDMNRGLEIYEDASFAGEWNSANSEESTSAIREVILPIQLLDEMKGSIRITTESRPEFKYKVFDDNLGCIELARQVYKDEVKNQTYCHQVSSLKD
eukprot:12221162-Ditylum_brightwellii.AAC.1